MSIGSLIVDKCLNITERDNVTIFFYPHNLPLAEEISDECFKKGADVLLNLYTDRYLLSYMTELTEESLRRPSVFCKTLTANSTAEIWMSGTYDPSILRKIPPKKTAAANEGEAEAHWPLSKEKKVRNLSVGLALVTKPRAKTYGFNYEKWRRMMKTSSAVDYDKLAQTGRDLMNSLRDAKSISVRGPGGTDLTFDVSGRRWIVSDGVIDERDVRNENFSDEIPAGSIYAAPLEESAQGKVVFDADSPYMGRRVQGLSWTFRDGRVAQFVGGSSTLQLKKEWKHATGDKERIGYFAIGFNPKAETGYTVNNMAYGAVSVGLGGNEDLGGWNKPGFNYVGTINGATVEADGRVVVKNGRLSAASS